MVGFSTSPSPRISTSGNRHYGSTATFPAPRKGIHIRAVMPRRERLGNASWCQVPELKKRPSRCGPRVASYRVGPTAIFFDMRCQLGQLSYRRMPGGLREAIIPKTRALSMHKASVVREVDKFLGSSRAAFPCGPHDCRPRAESGWRDAHAGLGSGVLREIVACRSQGEAFRVGWRIGPSPRRSWVVPRVPEKIDGWQARRPSTRSIYQRPLEKT